MDPELPEKSVPDPAKISVGSDTLHARIENVQISQEISVPKVVSSVLDLAVL